MMGRERNNGRPYPKRSRTYNANQRYPREIKKATQQTVQTHELNYPVYRVRMDAMPPLWWSRTRTTTKKGSTFPSLAARFLRKLFIFTLWETNHLLITVRTHRLITMMILSLGWNRPLGSRHRLSALLAHRLHNRSLGNVTEALVFCVFGRRV